MTRNQLEMPSGVGSGVMLDVLQGFVHELRAAGLPVSMTENLDAMRAVEHISLSERETFREVLAATLVKHFRHRRAFDTVFDVYFALYSGGIGDEDGADGEGGDGERREESGGVPGQQGSGGSGEGMSNEELAEMLLSALMNMDREQLRQLAAMAVARFAGMEPGRPVGGTYYLYRTLRQLDYDGLTQRMMERGAQGGDGEPGDEPPEDLLADRFQREEFEARLREFRELVEAEIRRRLVADRGVEAMARTLRKPLPEDVDFMHASREEMQQLQRAIEPLTRALAARLAQRRRRRNRGTLDFRQTVRHSLSYGGVPAEPKFKHPQAVEARDHGGGRHLRVGRELRPLHAAVRLRDGRAVLEGAVVGVHRRHRRGHALLRRVERAHRGRAPREHRGRRRVGRRSLRLRARVRGVPRPPPRRDHAEDRDHPARRRAQQLPRDADTGCSRSCGRRRAGSTG